MNAPTRTPTRAILADSAARALAWVRPHWDRGDGYDRNDPRRPAIYRCWTCDALRETEVAHCDDCGERTGSYVDAPEPDEASWRGGDRWEYGL